MYVKKNCQGSCQIDPTQSGYNGNSSPSFIPPVAVSKHGSLLGKFLGTLSSVGDSAMWMHDTVNQSHADLLLGCVPGSDFSCVLRVGQGSRNLHRQTSDDFDNAVFRSGLLDHEVYCLGDTVLTTPAYTISMTNALVRKAVSEPEDSFIEASQEVRTACRHSTSI